MSKGWFGTDGIRGKAGEEPLTLPLMTGLGLALGESCEGKGSALLARDTRESGPAIATALGRGLAGSGMVVTDLGVLPTAGLALAVRQSEAGVGLVISASHNPWEDNGVKVFGADGYKIDDDRESVLEEAMEACMRRPLPLDLPPTRSIDGAAAYRKTMIEKHQHLDLSGLTLAVDCAHGSATDTAPAVLVALGATVRPLGNRPDGRNINAQCGSTHMELLIEHVQEGGCDLGLAFDGDADRVLMVDRRGRVCTGDHMLGFLAIWLDGLGKLPERTVVATVMSNLGFERMLSDADLKMVRTPVGDRHILETMVKSDLAIGGEDSGHLLQRFDGQLLGDGLLTSLTVMEALVETGRDLTSVVDGVVKVPQVLLNVPVTSRPPLEDLLQLTAAQREAEEVHGDQIRILLRYSGTENLARVMVEGIEEGVVAEVSENLAKIWAEEIATKGGSG